MRQYVTSWFAFGLLAMIGCRGGLPGGDATTETFSSSMAAPSVPTSSVNLNATTDKQTANTNTQTSQKTQEEALAEVLGELTEIGALDATAKQLLMDDLRQAKPENWPMIVRQFRAALAFRKQLAEREQKAQAQQTGLTIASDAAEKPITQPAMAPAATPTVQARPQSSPGARLVSAEESLPKTRTSSPPAAQVVHSPPRPQSVEPAEVPLVLSKPPRHLAQQVSYTTSSTVPQGWRAHLQDAIGNLEAEVQPSPGSTDEVNEHMRLRLLQLLAGNEESALMPIPGATAPQQDYWSKQLFAVSTFLDAKHQPDDRRRAAGSLMHLDQARAKLAELATLQVRKLAFVDSVQGYGSYKMRDGSQFRPGDKVTLYAEIENFSSESTKEGYRTQLGTSYEVVDQNGKRVDSDQFPEIEDLCLTPRRDFHMQYTVTLPERIYPEKYELRLIISDLQSHKIGQANVAFEIVE